MVGGAAAIGVIIGALVGGSGLGGLLIGAGIGVVVSVGFFAVVVMRDLAARADPAEVERIRGRDYRPPL